MQIFAKPENVWKLSKTDFFSLNRFYNFWNSIFIALAVSFIMEMIFLFKSISLATPDNPFPTGMVVDIFAVIVVFIFGFNILREREKYGIAIEVKEQKLKEKEALNYIERVYKTF